MKIISTKTLEMMNCQQGIKLAKGVHDREISVKKSTTLFKMRFYHDLIIS